MAGYDFEFYETGTISVTAGEKAFTGSGTAWKLRGCEGALVIVSGAGAVNFVSTLDTDAAGEFRSAWTGPTLANAQYTMWLPSAVAATALANHQRLAEIIASIQEAQPESSNLTALAGLVGDAKTLVRYLADGSFDLIKSSDVGIQDPNDSLRKLSAITLSARQILQTDESGTLKSVALAAGKALVTDENKDVQQIDLGALGRALLALNTGTNAQYVQGDGTLQAKTGLPVSTAVSAALDLKMDKSGGTFTGNALFSSGVRVWKTLDVGGQANGKVNLFNSSNAQIIDMGVGSGTGFGNSFGIYNTSDGEFAVFTQGARRFTVAGAGAVSVSGSLSKGSGTFLIDHPLDPFNKNLRHGFVESTEYVNIYRGIIDLVDGSMIVDIDAAFGMSAGTFEALNVDVMVSSLQNQYGPDRIWVEGPAGSGKFTIVCEDAESTATIAWMVTGRRNDAFVRSDLDPNTDNEGRFIPEFDKEDA